MKKSKKTHIYYNFHFEEIRNKLFLLRVLSWDKNKERGYIDNSKMTKFKAFLVLIFVSLICLDTLYFIFFTKAEISKYDMFTVANCVITIIQYAKLNCESQQIQQNFSIIIHLLQLMDLDLSKYYSYSKTNRLVNYVTFALSTFVFATYTVLMPGFIFIFFAFSQIKTFIFVGIIIMHYSVYPIYLIIARVLLYDRLILMNALIRNFAKIKEEEAVCPVVVPDFIEFVLNEFKRTIVIYHNILSGTLRQCTKAF